MGNAERKTKSNIKALVLLSGGLDSRLAVKMMIEQGIDVLALNFVTCFCTCTAKSSCHSEAKKAAEEYGVKLKLVNHTTQLLEAVKAPKHGYGRGLNPCLDCRIAMFKEAHKIMLEEGASFIVTGEVLGERPMSQRLDAIQIIERDSGLKGKILRPLSAQLFEPTDAENEGIVNRQALLAIKGRSRKPQIELAKELGVNDYPCPAGGCLLTDKAYAGKLKNLLDVNPDPTNKQLNLLRAGRLFAIEECLVIVGKNEADNERIKSLKEENDILLNCQDVDGPTTIVIGSNISDVVLEKAAALTARYSQGREQSQVSVCCTGSKVSKNVIADPAQGFALAERKVAMA